MSVFNLRWISTVVQIFRRLLIKGEFPLLRKFYLRKDANSTVLTLCMQLTH